MKKFAILGDPDSIWIKMYIKEVLSSDSIHIVIFTDKEVSQDTRKQYPNNVKIVACLSGRLSKKLKIDKLEYLIRVYLAFAKEGKFDFLHIHFVNSRKLMLSNMVKRCVDRSVITFWGSDLLRKNKKELHKMEKYLEEADRITVGSNEMKKFFSNNYPEELCKKMSVVRFGVNGLSAIHSMQRSSDDLRKDWNIPVEKIVLSVGYNGGIQQNHIKVLEVIKTLPLELRKKIFLIFPMTYGLQNEYLKRVEEYAHETDCDFQILTDFMDSNRIAELCVLTDVFIHAQETDAFSASVQEYLCAGKLLISPVWIKYDELINNNIYYWEFNTFDEISELIKKYISTGLSADECERLVGNKERMYLLSSWSNLRHKWLEVYDSIGS